MSDQKRLLKHLEEYLFAADKEAYLSKLLPDTDEYTYLRLTYDLIKNNGEFSAEMQAVFDRLIGKDKTHYDFKKGVKARELLYSLGRTQDKKELKNICKQINALGFNYRFTHKRPKIAEKMATDTGDQVQRESVFPADPESEQFNLFTGDKGSVEECSLQGLKSGYLLDRNLDELMKVVIDKSSYIFPQLLSRLPSLKNVKTLNKHILAYFKKESSPDYEALYKRLTAEQLIALGAELKDPENLNTTFVNELYHKSFPENPSINAIKDLPLLKQVYLYTLNPKISGLYPGLKRTVLRILLEFLLKDGKTDPEFLEDFIKNPSQEDQIFSKKVLHTWKADYHSFNFVSEPNMSIPELISGHLRLLHRSGQDIAKFEPYFKETFFKKLKAEIMLKAGEKIERVLETFSKTELDFLNDEKTLQFVDKQRDFKSDEDVCLKLEIKNTQKLTVRVFEINTLNYCRELVRNVEDNVRLDGLVSISEMAFTYNQPSIVAHVENFPLPELKGKKRGVFVVDFIGEGTTSRAIIRKGYLSLLTKKTRTGYNCKILDESYAVCKGAHTGAHLQGKFYEADAEGTIRLEYPSYSSTHSLVLEHDGFCYVVTEKMDTETVNLSANWIYSEETFLPGNKCNLALNAAMYVSGSRVPLAGNLKETKIEVEFLKVKNIRSSEKIESLTLKDGEEYIYSFYLPKGTKQITLKTTFTYPTLKGINSTSEHNHTIYLLDRESQYNKTHIFLRNVNDKYILYHLGKNGEAIPGTELSVTVSYIWKRDKETQTLITDKDGAVTLGPLRGATMISVAPVDSGDENLNTYFNIWDECAAQCVEQIFKTEGESFRLPILSQFEQKGQEYCLLKVNTRSKTVIEDFSANVSKKEGFYMVDGLTAGEYVFRYVKSSKKVTINVLKGQYLSDETIQSSKSLYRVPEKNYQISNLAKEILSEDKQTLTLALDSFSTNTRVHVLSETFLEEGSNRMEQINQLNNPNSNLSEERVTRITQPRVSYLEDRQLPGEMVYAMNRRYNDAAIGTTSQKPSLFIKRQEVRDTHYMSEENVQGEYDYQNQVEEVSEAEDNDYDNDYDDDYRYERKAKAKPRRANKGGRGRGRAPVGNFLDSPDDYNNASTSYSNNSACNAFYFDKIRHFLNTPSTALWNLKPDSKGHVAVPLAGFPSRTLKVFVVNDSFCTSKTLNIDTTDQVKTTDLRLKEASSVDKMFAYERDVYKLFSSVQTEVPGFSSCQFELVDSVAKILSVKAELSGDQLGETWSFLKNWSTLKIGQKLKTIDEMFSYELALYLFKKDKEFFDVTVKDFLVCKVNKGLLDYYMLEQTDKLAQYFEPSLSAQLNTLERICLIDALAKSHPAQCQNLLLTIQGQDALNSYDGNLSFPSLFDRVINSGDRRGDKVQLQQISSGNDGYQGEFDDDANDDDDDSCGSDDSRPKLKPAARNRALPRAMYQERKECKMECEEEVDYGHDLFGAYDEAPMQYQQECIQQECDFIEQQECRMERPKPRAIKRRLASGSSCNDDDDPGSSPSDEDEDKDDPGHFNLMDIKKRRKEPTVTRLIQNGLKPTKEYREMGYYFQPRGENRYEISSNLFWVDLAKHLLSENRAKPFLSENFLYITGQQLPFALAFLSLSHVSPAQKFQTEKGETYLTLEGGNGLIFLKHLKERPQVPDTSNTVLAAQKWFERTDRFEYNPETGKNEEKTVTYFLKDRVYGCQVVVTNVSSVEQKIQVITEIPKGAIPVYQNEFHQSLDFTLSAFSTQTSEFYFYFPQSGQYNYCPACVTRDGKKVSIQTNSLTLTVLDEPPKKTELKSIKDILAQGSKEDILNFMKKENINNSKVFQFGEVYWLLRDEQFYSSCLAILKDRQIFDETVWAYSLYHADIQTLFELLQYYCSRETKDGPNHFAMIYFDNKSADAKLRLKMNFFRFREYHPIVNPRFHQLSKEKSSILNQQFFETYTMFLVSYFEKGVDITFEDRLVLTYYLLLQDRIDEAFSVYSALSSEDAQKAGYSLQFDYMGAYFDLYKGMPTFSKAKTICEKYFDYPIISWRSLFIEVANQLAELEGDQTVKKVEVQVQNNAGDAETLRPVLQESNIEIDYANLTGLKVELFEVDLEVLFSMYPFRTNEFDSLIFSQPHHVLQVPTEKSQVLKHISVPLPESFAKKNLLVKVSTQANACRSVLVYSYNRLSTTVSQETGKLKVSDKQNWSVPVQSLREGLH
jgi:hypothetical protein